MHFCVLGNMSTLIKGRQEEACVIRTYSLFCTHTVQVMFIIGSDYKKYNYCRDFKVCISKAVGLKLSSEAQDKYQLLRFVQSSKLKWSQLIPCANGSNISE